MDLHHDLDDQLAQIGDEAESSFVIDDIDKANWAVRKLGVYAARLAEAEAFAQRERDNLDVWLAGERERAEQSSSFLAGLLRRYHEDRLEADPKVRTIHLPAGDLTARKSPDRWEVDNDEDLIAWAEQSGWGEVVRRRDPEVDRNALKRTFHVAPGGTVLAPDGEVVPGVTVVEGEVSFKVKPRVVEQ
jgi:hypothetical protein